MNIFYHTHVIYFLRKDHWMKENYMLLLLLLDLIMLDQIQYMTKVMYHEIVLNKNVFLPNVVQLLDLFIHFKDSFMKRILFTITN